LFQAEKEYVRQRLIAPEDPTRRAVVSTLYIASVCPFQKFLVSMLDLLSVIQLAMASFMFEISGCLNIYS